MSEERKELCLGGGDSWRKGLPSATKAKSVLLLQRLHNIAPLTLLEFHPETAAITVDWLLGKITKAESLGGADLQGKVIGQTKAAGLVVAIGATSERLLLEADEELLFRPKPFYCSRELQPSTACGPSYPGEAEGLCGMLSSAEAVNLVQKILSQLTVGEREEVLGVSVLPGDPVMDSLRRHGIITDSYPLHDALQLAHLRQTFRACWAGLKSFTKTDRRHCLAEMKGYFGEGVAHYFGFLEFFINTLFLKSLLAVVLYNVHLSNSWNLSVFSFSNMIWSGLFLQGWKQRSKRGPKGQRSSSCSPDSTGLKDTASDLPQQQRGNSAVNIYHNTFLQSILFLVSMFLLSSVLILVCFHLDTIIWNFSHKKQMSPITQTLNYLPDILLAMAIEGVDHIALRFSLCLYAKPLHQGHQARLYEPLLPELVIISIYNHFAIHFCRALVQHDLITLNYHITVQLVTQTAFHLLIGGLFPYLRCKWTGKLPSHCQLERRPPFLKQIHDQINRPTRNSIETNGHINMLIAYCHVMLISGIYPLCALWCLLRAVAQSHLDFWQMSVIFRRPFPQATSGMEHTWHCLFEIVDLLSTVANAILLWTSSDFQLFLSGLSQWEVVKIMLGLLLLLMGLKMAVMSAASRIFSSSDPQEEQPRLRQYRPHCQ